MRVFVAGASGVIGTPLLRVLHAGEHVIGALTRDAARVPWFDEMTIVAADILGQPDEVRRRIAEFEPDVIVNQLTAIPDRINTRAIARDMATTNQLRIEATRTLAAAADDCDVTLVSQSIAFAYDPRGGGDPHVESDPLFVDGDPSFQPMVDALRLLEEQTLAVEGVVLRYGSLYGEGTIYAKKGSFAEDVQRRRIPIIGDGSGVFSFIHVEDAARATVAALQAPTGIYNIVDDTPQPVARWLPDYAKFYKWREPLRVPLWIGRVAAGPYGTYLMVEQRGASNARAREMLGWAPKFTDLLAGLRRERYGD